MQNRLKKIFQRKSVKFSILLGLILMIFGFISGRFIFVEAENAKINVYPGNYRVISGVYDDSVSWEGLAHSFHQSLSGRATWPDFDLGNSSAFVFPGAEDWISPRPEAAVPAVPETEDSSDPEQAAENFPPELEDGGNDAASPGFPAGEPADEAVPAVPETEDSSDPEQAAENFPPELEDGGNDAAGAEPADEAEAEEDPEIGFWPAFKAYPERLADRFRPAYDASAADEPETFNFGHQQLVFEDFDLPFSVLAAAPESAVVRLSLAARSEFFSDYLLLTYSLGEAYSELARININSNISNGAIGDYFYFPIPRDLSWDDLGKLKIKLAYVNHDQDKLDLRAAVLLDALWLEVNYETVAEVAGDLAGTVLGVQENSLAEIIDNGNHFDFPSKEAPVFDFEYRRRHHSLLSKISAGLMSLFRDEYRDLVIEASVLDAKGQAIKGMNSEIRRFGKGRFIVSILRNKTAFKPGKYTLLLDVKDDDINYRYLQDFSWGVLAFNVNRSVFLPGETAYLQMGVLDSGGHTICDADLELEITAPDGKIHRLDTGNGLIERNPDCNGDTVIDAADYSGYFQVDLIGAYRVKVKAETKAGTEEILDGFTAVADRPFDIERSGPTRIFPLADYEMKIVIRANEDFQGEVAEYVPEGFQISNVKFKITNDECRMTNNALDNNENCNRHSIRQPADDIRQAEDGQAIVFSDIDLRAGEEAEITYIFDAPDVSPQFYLLGPLGLFNDNSSFDIGHSTFSEARKWQIAADDVGTYNYNDPGASVNWTSAGNAWDSSDDTYASRDIPRRNEDDSANYLEANANNAPSASHTINTVEIGFEGYVESTDVSAIFYPRFSGTTNGNSTTVSGATMTTADTDGIFWYDISEDPQAPSTWTWDDVRNLDIRLYGVNADMGNPRELYIDQFYVRVDYILSNETPTTTIISAAQKTDGTGVVDAAIGAGDEDGDELRARVEYEAGATCAFSSVSKATIDETDANTTADKFDPKVENDNYYQIGNASGYIDTATGSNRVYFDWLTKTDLPNADGTYCLRIWVNDGYATSSAATSTLTLDNIINTAPGALSVLATTSQTVRLSFGSAGADTNFSGYRIYYKEWGGSPPDEAGSYWSQANDSSLGSANYGGAASTTITGLFPSRTYVFDIWLLDDYGNRASSTAYVLAETAYEEVVPIISFNSLAQGVNGDGRVNFSIEVDDGNDDDVRVKVEYVADPACNFSSPLDPYLDPASLGYDFGTPAIDNDSDYQVGAAPNPIITSSGSNTVTFDWLTKADLPEADGIYCLRITANDAASGDGTPATSTVVLDNVSPTPPGGFALVEASGSTITVNIASATSSDTNFKEYRMFLATTSPVYNGSWEHHDDNFNYSDFNSAAETTIEDLEPDTTYYLNLWAYDDYGNRATGTEISAKTSEAEPIRARTVTFLAGTYSGNGSTGYNSDTDLSFSAFSFELAEGAIEIENAFVVFEAQFEAYANNAGNYTGYNLAFDACVQPCAANAWSGSGRVLDDDNTVLAYDETESNQVRLILDVTEEAQLAAYEGSGAGLEGRVGFRLERGGAVNSIASARAVLYITYIYNENESSNYTNTVVYPLDSTSGTDSGTRMAIQARGCTPNTDCPTFAYNMYLPDRETALSQWFAVDMMNYHNNQTRTDDTTVKVNIQTIDTDSDLYIHENALAGGQGVLPTALFNAINLGIAKNTTQYLEVVADSSNYDYYLMGGEVFETYTAPMSTTTKTRTVSFPLGVVNNGVTTAASSESVDVYFPENGQSTGSVTVRSAWFRVLSSNITDSAVSVTIATEVGDNAQSGNYAYAYRPQPIITKPNFRIIHIIPSSDYGELADANISNPKTVTLYTTNENTNQGGLSAELMITYTYTDEANGYLASLALNGGQIQENGNAQSATTTTANMVIAEQIGTKTIRAGGLLASYLVSDSDGDMPAANALFDANLATGNPACTNAYYIGLDGQNAFGEFYKDIASVLLAVNNTAYTACYSNNGGADASAGAKMNGIIYYTYQYDAPAPELTQDDWRWYANANSVEPGAALAGGNTPINSVYPGDVVRLRINIGVSKRALATSSQAFKLQYAKSADCAGASPWYDVGGIGSTADWRGYNNSAVSDGDAAGALYLGSSDVIETYEEENPSAINPSGIPKDRQGEWDWVLYNQAATSSSDYCFRLIKSDDSPLTAYNADGYPRLNTAKANTATDQAAKLGQYKSDGVTAIANNSWTDESSLMLTATATDRDISEAITLYFEFIKSSESFTTATAAPALFCYSGAAYGDCPNRIWAASSTVGDYRQAGFKGTTTITGIPDTIDSRYYKWQVLACDDDHQCTAWKSFNAGINVRVDHTPPTRPGALAKISATPTNMTLELGATSTEINFYRYRIYYKVGAPGVTTADQPHTDLNLNDQDYDGATTTLVINLSSNTTYYFNIWAFDLAGNATSSLYELEATTTSSLTEPTGTIQTMSQATDGSGGVQIVIRVADADNDNTLRARVFYEAGTGCNFNPVNNITVNPDHAFITASVGNQPAPDVDNDAVYQIGTTSAWIKTSGGPNFVSFYWLSKTEVPLANGTYCVGLIVNDGIYNSLATSSQTILIDNVPPSAPGPLTYHAKNRNSVTLNFGGQSNDPRFSRYRLFYSTASPVTEADQEKTDPNLLSVNYGTAATTTIGNLRPGTAYYFNIWAYDIRGNRASSTMYATTTNYLPANLGADRQARGDDLSPIDNGAWTSTNTVALAASVYDNDLPETLTLYYQLVANADSFLTATTVPANACADGTSWQACNSKVWRVDSPAGDYSVSPFSATTTINGLPDSALGYKWQVLACDSYGDCAETWAAYNLSRPNFKVDITAPQNLGDLGEYAVSSRYAVLNFGTPATEANFYEYKIFYATTSPPTESDSLLGSSTDSNLASRLFNGAATTTISGLSPNTAYYINIWAYDQAGNKASATPVSITTNAVASTPGVVFYTKNSRVLYYRVWTGTAWNAEQTGPTLGSAVGDNIRHLRAIRSDDGTRVGLLAKTWDGTNQEWWGAVYNVAADSFATSEILGSAYANADNNQLITGCIAALSGGEFMIVRNNNGSNGTLVHTWNSTDNWTDEGAGPDPGGVVNGCQLVRRPGTDNYLLVTFDDTITGTGANQEAGDVGTAYYYGGAAYADSWTAWTEHSTVEEDTDNYVGEAFFDPSDNTRGLINYSNSNTALNTTVRRFTVNDTAINYGATAVSPSTWNDDFVHGEFAVNPAGGGIAYYIGDDITSQVNVFLVSATSTTPKWQVPANSDNISGGNLYGYTNDAQKPYAAVFYKDNYGVALWNNNASAAPNYRVINAVTNSLDAGNSSVPDAGSAIYTRIRTYADPNEEEFVAIYQSQEINYYAVFWDGVNDRFYNSTDDSGSNQVWTTLLSNAGAADYDDECAAFAFTAGNAAPYSPSNLRQFRADGAAAIANGDWTNEDTVVFEVGAKDLDTSEVLSVYLNLVAANDDFNSSTSRPSNFCASTTAFTACDSKIWHVATSSAGDYSAYPFVATATITAIADSGSVGYKWQVKVCDDDNACSGWVKFNLTTPNFKVDTTKPQNLGPLSAAAKTSNSVTLNFGTAATEPNFSEYKIFYKANTGGVTETDSAWTRTNNAILGSRTYSGQSSITISDLASSTLYYFNIFAYDLAGNVASATPEAATTTSAGPYIRQVSFLIENDDGATVNSNSAAAALGTGFSGAYIGERFNVRLQIENSGGDTAGNWVYKLQYDTNSDGNWQDVGAGTAISYSLGLSGSNNSEITGGQAGLNAYAFFYGTWHEGTGQTANFSLPHRRYTEFVFAVQTKNAAAGSSYRFRLARSDISRPLEEYSSYPSIAIRSADTLRYSKDSSGSLLANYNDLTYYLDPKGYADTAADDGQYDAIASSSNYLVYNFSVGSSSAAAALSPAWTGQAGTSTLDRPVYLQVYHFGSSAWVTVDSESVAGAFTDFTLSGNINADLDEYYDGANRTYWRIWQNGDASSLRTDYFRLDFVAPVPYVYQAHYRWRSDYGNETGADWIEDEDTGSPSASSSIEIGQTVRLRLSAANTGGGSAAAYEYGLEYASTTVACDDYSGAWAAVPADASEHWTIAGSAYVGDGDPTTGQFDNSEAYDFAAGYVVASPSSTSDPVTLDEDEYTEIEYVISATVNAQSAGTYCFRLTDKGQVLDAYARYPIVTLSGVFNTAPYFTASPSDSNSASTSPTNYGSLVNFIATAADDEGDDYYLAICKTAAISAGNDGPPICGGGAWCVSELASSSEQASCSYTIATTTEINHWHAFVCDKYPGFAVGKCSPASQGYGTIENNSPFVVNNPPVFTSINTSADNQDPGDQFIVSSVSYDTDTAHVQDTLKLYVCLNDSASFSGCDGPPANTLCATTTMAADAHCSFTPSIPSAAATIPYYAFLFDSHNLAAPNNSLSGTYTIRNAPTVIGSVAVHDNDAVDGAIVMNMRPATTTIQIITTSLYDKNGCQSIESASARFYMSAASGGELCAEDDNDCYHVDVYGCVRTDCDGPLDTTAGFTCTADLRYFAIPTDDEGNNPYEPYHWLGYIRVHDGANYTSSTSPPVEVQTSIALIVDEDRIYFGDNLFPGDNTGSKNATSTIINAGNSPINTNLRGTDMSGTPSGNIGVSNIKYDLNLFDYAFSGWSLSSGGDDISLEFPRPTSLSPVSNKIYWGIFIPYGTDANVYTGINTFSVFLDSSGEGW